MAVINLETIILAPIERVFDLARSIEAHQHSTGKTGERAVAGRTSGLMGADEEVTWKARHFFVWQRLTVRITEFNPPTHFQDVMLKGAFSMMRHDHDFRPMVEGTVMTDCFEFLAPFGPLGRITEKIFLTNYLAGFLGSRNKVLKHLAESDEWKAFL